MEKIKRPVFRSVKDIIKEMFLIIPKTETNLLKDIEQYYENELFNKAPEILRGPQCWVPLQNILTKHITCFDKEWKLAVLKLFNGE